MTPCWSTLAMAGVSEVHVMVVTMELPLPPRTMANSSSWKPTGRAGLELLRPLNVMRLADGGGGEPVQAPKPAVDGASHVPLASRCSDCPTGDDASATPISVDVIPMAGPSVATNVPPYDRNSTTAPLLSTRAKPSGFPFCIPFDG